MEVLTDCKSVTCLMSSVPGAHHIMSDVHLCRCQIMPHGAHYTSVPGVHHIMPDVTCTDVRSCHVVPPCLELIMSCLMSTFTDIQRQASSTNSPVWLKLHLGDQDASKFKKHRNPPLGERSDKLPAKQAHTCTQGKVLAFMYSPYHFINAGW
eukprot:532910-Pelagomonas_calceolata.AAC.3